MLSHLPGADSSRVWVVSGAVLVQKTDTCIPVLPQTSSMMLLNEDVLPLQLIWRSTAWYFDISGERLFYLKKLISVILASQEMKHFQSEAEILLLLAGASILS